jgi:hypothetical protein
MGHVAVTSALSASRFSGFGRARSGETVIHPPAAAGDLDVRVARQLGFEAGEARAHLPLQAGDEQVGIERQAERLVVGLAPLGEVRRQVFVRVAITIGADDPDLLGAQPLSQRL